MKRSRSGMAVASALVVLGVAAALAGLGRPGPGPSILLITVDTLRADRLGCYGHAAARTPVMDALAAEGARFEDCAASAPVTLPSHASLLTGLHPPRHGLRLNETPLPLPPASRRPYRTAAEILGGAGWQTAAFVSAAPLAPRWGLDQGFATYDAAPDSEPGDTRLGEREAGATITAALGWLSRREKGRPFLLWVHLFDPHFPYAPPGGSGHPPDSPLAYDEEVAYADRQVGRLLDALRESGDLDRTVVALCSDHGEGLGEHDEATHGYFLHRSTLRVPLLLRYPRRIAAGSRVAAPVALVDVLPTLLDLCRKQAPGPALDGRSLLPALVDGAAPPPRSDQYGETLYGWSTFGWAQGVTRREGERRVVDWGGDRRRAHDMAADPGETREAPAAPGDAESAARAWALFTTEPMGTALDGGGPAPGLEGLGYIGPFARPTPLAAGSNGLLPVPSAGFLRRFDAAVRTLQSAETEEGEQDALDRLHAAREALLVLAEEQPANPAVAFWLGRTWRGEAILNQDRLIEPWKSAFDHFQRAGRLGYRDARTVSLMLEALFHLKLYDQMIAVGRDALGGEVKDGDSGFWTWLAIGWIEGERDAYGKPTANARARFDDCIQRALRKVRGPAEERRIREVQAYYR